MNKKIELTIRIVLGIALLVFGLDKFLAFVPHGHVMTEELVAAYQGLLANKFIMPTVGVVEIVSGLILISGRYVIVGLTAMIPIVYGILGFHLAVDINGIIPGLLVATMLAYLVLYRKSVISETIKKFDAI